MKKNQRKLREHPGDLGKNPGIHDILQLGKKYFKGNSYLSTLSSTGKSSKIWELTILFSNVEIIDLISKMLP